MKRALGIAAVMAVLAALAPASAGAVGFGIKGVESSLLGTGGEPLLTAGAHADFTAAVHLNTTVDPAYPPEGVEPADNAKDVEVMLPRGLIANPTGTETCSQEAFANLGTGTFCDPASQVGIATTIFYEQGIPLEFPTAVYNLEPPVGLAAQFGFSVAGTDIFLNGGVTGRGEYRLQAVSDNVPETLAFADTSVTIWGLPFSPSHDSERSPLTPFGNQQPQPGEPPVPSEGPKLPFVTNPTACTGESLRTDARADSWQNPGVFVEGGTDTDPQGRPLVIDGCEGLPFEASVEVQPTTEAAESPSGLDVDLKLPQSKLLGQRPASTLREAVITLPEGMAINPSSAGGLASCTPAQIGLGNDAQPTCPDAAKIGSAEIETPLLNHPLPGSVYLAQQGTNKFGSLLALYLVVDDPATGDLIKIPGKVDTDPVSGRLVASFPNAPQLPFEDLEVNLFPGPRAPLLTPPACGTYSSRGEFVPWSGTATVVSSDSFRVTTGPNGSACPTGAFGPTLRAASANAAAGQFSPFEIQLGREDGSQRFSGVSVALPKGLLARLAGVPYCADAALGAIPTAEGTGAAQVASPSCPAASRVGSLSVAAGAGPSPFWDKQGSVYLAGPYKGAPLSLAFVVPALAGPFDLGNVAERVALDVNPVTTQVTAISDPLPTILAGIPLDLAIDLDPDRSAQVHRQPNLMRRADRGGVADLDRRRQRRPHPALPRCVLRRARLLADPGAEAEGTDAAQRLPGAHREPDDGARPGELRPGDGRPAALGVPRAGAHRDDLHAGPVRRAPVPRGLDLRLRGGQDAAARQADQRPGLPAVLEPRAPGPGGGAPGPG